MKLRLDFRCTTKTKSANQRQTLASEWSPLTYFRTTFWGIWRGLVGYTSYKTLPYVSNFQPWPWRIIDGFFPKYINKAFI